MALTKLYHVKLHISGRDSSACEEDVALWEAIQDSSDLSKADRNELQNIAQLIKNREKSIRSATAKSASAASEAVDLCKGLVLEQKAEGQSEWLLAPAEEEEEEEEIREVAPPVMREVKHEEAKKEEEVLDVSAMAPEKVNWFKHIIDSHVEEGSTLYNAETLGFVLERLMSGRSEQELQGELVDIFGYDNLDLLMSLF